MDRVFTQPADTDGVGVRVRDQVKPVLGERDICTKFLLSALETAGRDRQMQVREEVSFPEQYRIIAKVDELMKLCDGLEAALTRERAEADRLFDAVAAKLKAA